MFCFTFELNMHEVLINCGKNKINVRFYNYVNTPMQYIAIFMAVSNDNYPMKKM